MKASKLFILALLWPVLAFAGGVVNPGGGGATPTASSDVSSITNSGYNVACWGDSLTQGVGGTPYPTQLSALVGTRNVENFGIPGYTSAQILASEFQVHPERLRGLNIIWAGYNDIHNNSGITNSTIMANIAAMVALIPAPQNYAIVSVINTGGASPGTAQYTQTLSLNSSLSSTYGSRYLDVRSYLVAQYNPAQSGDVAAHANDSVPPSLMYSDGIHLNSAGYLAVATFLANNAAAWGGGQAVTTNVGVGSILATGPQVGSLTRGALGYYDLIGAGMPANGVLTIAPTAPMQAVKPSTTTGTAMKISSPNYTANDVTLMEFTTLAGQDIGATNRMAAIGATTLNGGGGDLVFYTAPTPTGSYADRLHVQRDGGIALTGADSSGSVLTTNGSVKVISLNSGIYPSVFTVDSTPWNYNDGEGAGLSFIGTEVGNINNVLGGMRYYGKSRAWAWKVNGTLATGGTVDSGADATLTATGLTTAGGNTIGTTGTHVSRFRHATTTLAAGTVTVSDTAVTAATRIFVGNFTFSGAVGVPYVSALTAGTGYTISDTNTGASNQVDILLIDP